MWKTSFLYQINKNRSNKKGEFRCTLIKDSCHLQLWPEGTIFKKQTNKQGLAILFALKMFVRFLAQPHNVCAFVEDTGVGLGKVKMKKKI